MKTYIAVVHKELHRSTQSVPNRRAPQLPRYDHAEPLVPAQRGGHPRAHFAPLELPQSNLLFAFNDFGPPKCCQFCKVVCWRLDRVVGGQSAFWWEPAKAAIRQLGNDPVWRSASLKAIAAAVARFMERTSDRIGRRTRALQASATAVGTPALSFPKRSTSSGMKPKS